MEPQIQYAKTRDDVSIAFWAMGAGDPPLVIVSPFGWSHISDELHVPDLRSWYDRLAARRTVVRYDPRCQGLSDREVERFTAADLAADLEAVIDRIGSTQVDLLGCNGPGVATLGVAAEHPATVRRLILWNVNVRGPEAYAKQREQALLGLIETDWELFTRTFAATRLGWTSEVASQWAGYIRRAVTPRDAAIILEGLGKIDWNPWLAKIHAPVLVLRGWSYDPDTEGRWADIADVRVVDLDRRDRIASNAQAYEAIGAFLADGEAQDEEAAALPSGTAVILFADIADSTGLTERLGDAAFRERARGLEDALRAAIRTHGGTPVEGKLLGDGVLATFVSSRDAIASALACAAAGDDAGFGLHLGIHAGDVIREEGNVFGGAVIVAARISDASAPGEVLVSDIVRGLARTSAGVTFEDRGERELKGVSEPVRVFAVRQAE